MLTMTRAELKKKFDYYRPSLIRPEMYETASERKLAALREGIRLRYVRSMRALYAKKTLSDEQRWVEYRKIETRDVHEREKLAPLERRVDLIGQRRLLEIIKWTKAESAVLRRRVAA